MKHTPKPYIAYHYKLKMNTLPDEVMNHIYKYKHNLDYKTSMNNITMFRQKYEDIPRYKELKSGDHFEQIEINLPIKKMLMPLKKNTIEINTSNTTKYDGEYNFLFRGQKYMKQIEKDMEVKIRIDGFNFVYGVNGGMRFNKFQIKFLNKHRKALVGDIITIINRLRLESSYEKVVVIDVNVRNMNKLKQCVDLVFKRYDIYDDGSTTDDDIGYSNLYGVFDNSDEDF